MIWYITVLCMLESVAGIALIGKRKEVITSGDAVFSFLMWSSILFGLWRMNDGTSTETTLAVVWTFLVIILVINLLRSIGRERTPLYRTVREALLKVLVNGSIITTAWIIYTIKGAK